MRQRFCGETFWSVGFWVVLGGVAVMLMGWPAGADPAHSVQSIQSGVLSSGGLLAGGLVPGTRSAVSGQQGLISYVHTSDTRATSVILIDPVQQVISVYHIGRDDGRIQLKSVRKIAWDFSLTDYNTSKPLPAEIHKGLQRQ